MIGSAASHDTAADNHHLSNILHNFLQQFNLSNFKRTKFDKLNIFLFLGYQKICEFFPGALVSNILHQAGWTSLM
jgi:hypothetical protein